MAFDFTSTDLPQFLSTLDPGQAPLWGRMSAQNMVEHVSSVMRISNGKNPLQIELTPDRIERGRAFLLGPEPLPRDVKITGVPSDPPPHRFPDMATAIARLQKEVDDFHAYWQSPPAELPWHPRFGPLNYQEWIVFHNKHFTHHFTQFGLLPD
jgi:hypothetical protein